MTVPSCRVVDTLVAGRRRPTLLIDNKANILSANAQASALLGRGSLISMSDCGDLQSHSDQGTAKLHSAVHALNETTVGRKLALYLNSSDDAEALIILTRVQAQGDLKSFTVKRCPDDISTILVTVHDGSWRRLPCDDRVLRESFGFSAIETDLAFTLMQGGTLRSFAGRNGLEVATARRYLRAALKKCRCTSTHEFVVRVCAVVDV